ncbi:t-SNARE affecting a late Golgi compartment protein 1 [Candida viswanathii]|uniref:t-SNARE affecting a late Golgi compartment protein 1 n=1 Tax=Candida viswanathii TaxID=5486 RepID=A0A367YHC7_9ASCO|nr:t-SNARE affecting a late Golgi compartment protein 1 [Candida viswanathii]
MDPFNEVKEDAYNSIRALESIIKARPSGQPPTSEQQYDFENNYQELQEIYQDLQQALSISESQPAKFNLSDIDISNRKSVLLDLDNRMSQLQNTWNTKQYRDVTTMSNRISQDGGSGGVDDNPFADDAGGSGMTSYQQQELINEQDTQLDDIHRTMMNLNQQASIMGNELEEQGYMLDELDYELDNVDNKLQRGMKRINIFLERNKETASNWCIGILVVVLCILLVVLIIA